MQSYCENLTVIVAMKLIPSIGELKGLHAVWKNVWKIFQVYNRSLYSSPNNIARLDMFLNE